MDSLDNTEWDVLIVGTGLQQSLLALALSRSQKRILHIDENNFYGGNEAAFSLQEAEAWAARVNSGSLLPAFSQASIHVPQPTETDSSAPRLASSRTYNLALRPQIVYSRAKLVEYLVSSRVFRQLEFLAVGGWWVYTADSQDSTGQASRTGSLLKVPNGREDVFQASDLDFKAKRALMKFLRFIAEYEEQVDVWDGYRAQSFHKFLTEQFKVPDTLHGPLLALTLSNASSDCTTTEFALPRIALHLRSIGHFGPSFGAVLPKWGGLAEVCQVACRASAVGGAVYVLGKGLSSVNPTEPDQPREAPVTIRLREGETVTTRWVVGEAPCDRTEESLCKSITIVSPPLKALFPPIAEEAPAPASAVVVFPSGSLIIPSSNGEELPPVHIHVHSSDTGECPPGQNVLYASTSITGDRGFQLLQVAVDALLATADASHPTTTLWCLRYEQRAGHASCTLTDHAASHMLTFPPVPLDLATVDPNLEHVKSVWQTIMGDDAGDFLVFADREAYDDDQ